MTADAQDAERPAGWAGFAAPDRGLVLLVPLTASVLAAGEPLADAARQRARERHGDPALAADILAGNAWLALGPEPGAGGAVAACLGGIARLLDSRCLVVRAVRDGESLDCTVEPLPPTEDESPARAAVRARLAQWTGLSPGAIRPGWNVVSEAKDAPGRNGARPGREKG